MAGLRELAKHSGYSIRVVTRVLKKRGYVSPIARVAVETSISELGYHPSFAARALKEKRSHIVAVLAFSTDEMRMAQVAVLQQELRREHFLVSVTFQVPSADKSAIIDTLRSIIGQRPAGIAVLGDEPEVTNHAIPALIPMLVKCDIPYVLLDPKGFEDKAKRFDSIKIDRTKGVEQAVHYLARKGRKRIAYLGTQEERSRLDGYEKALKALGRKPIFLEYPGPTPDALREAALKFSRMKKRPDAVLAHSDFIAMAFLAGLHDAGVKVPEDVALIGFDNRYAAGLCWPPLTTIAQPTGMVGEAAAHLLLRKIEGLVVDPADRSLTFPTELIIRGTA